MSNWSDAADRIYARRQEDEARQQSAKQVLEATMTETAQQLEQFMAEHGDDARKLLKAAKCSIVLGRWYSTMVCLDSDGLWHKEICPVRDERWSDATRVATAHEAVEFFVHDNAQSRKRNPEQLIKWLRDQLDAIKAEAYK